jgi:circadian clock protein KaiC
MISEREDSSMTDERMLLPTGMAGLDTILGGGLSRPSLTVIIGTPGAGKTILASQMIFNAARHGLKTIVFTSFSEGIEQYVEHMRALDFFDAALLGDSVQLFTLASLITDEDATPAMAIGRIIRTTGAKVVLLDGFQGADALLPTDQAIRLLLSTLATQIRFLDTTLLVTIAGEVRDAKFHSEMTVADAAIGLSFSVHGRRHQRLLEVVKLRGRAQQPGLHSYRITGTGVEVFPRIETYPPLEARSTTMERVPFQLPELDQVLRGGLNRGTTTLLAGAPGVGKTTLGLQWALAQTEPDSVSLFVSFAEHPEQLARKAAAFGLDVQSAIDSGRVRVVRLASADLNPDHVATIVLAELAKPEVSRLVIDDISILLHELGERTRDYLSALNDLVYGAQATGLYLLEITPFDGLRVNLTNSPLAVLGDNVIVVQQYEIAGQLRRILAVLRMRLSFFDRTLRELILDESGIRIAMPDERTLHQLQIGIQLRGGVPEATRDVGDETGTSTSVS